MAGDESAPTTALILVALLTLSLAALTVDQHHPTASPRIPWWVLTGMFLVAESDGRGVVRDRSAVSSPIARIVLMLGLFLAHPLALIVAHALGSLLAALPRLRRSPRRVGELVVGSALSTTVGAWAYLAVTGSTAPTGPEGWVDGIAAASLAVACATVLGAAILATRGFPGALGPWVTRTLVSDVLAVATGLIVVEILRIDPYAAWLLLAPTLAAYAVHRQYVLAGWRADALGTIHHLARRLHQATDRTEAVALALTEARAVCRAATATLVLWEGDELVRWSSDDFGAVSATEAGGDRLASLPLSSDAYVVEASPLWMRGWHWPRRPSLVTPLLRGGATQGYMALQRTRRHPFTRLEVQVAETLVASLGAALETIANLEGLTERHLHTARLLAQQDRVTEELKRVSDAKSVILATTSHELRAPLGALLAQTELLDQLLPNGRGAELCRDLNGRARADALHLLCLVDDLLDLSRIEVDRLELRWESTDLRAVAEEVATSVRSTLMGNPHRLTVGGATRVTLEGDRVRLRQIVTNLVHNAARATEQRGEVHVEVGTRDGNVRLEVIDTGSGIAATDLERMFEPFERCRPHERGLGLGLTIARRLVEAHGGTLDAVSTLGVGSQFTAMFPNAAKA